MEISNLTFIVTDECNFNCAYCVQKKEKKTINNACIKTAVDFFYPFLKQDVKVYIGFYGGEPLLAYEQIKHTVRLVQEKNKTGNKKITFSVTTNGSLLTDKMLDFFNRSQFAVTLSYDGFAQDMGRKKGTLDQMIRLMKQIQDYPNIDFEINSVFTPQTIKTFSESLRFMIEPGGPEITFNLSTMEEWEPSHLETLKEELKRLTDFLVLYYKKTGKIPVKNFQVPVPGPGIFRCSAGKDHMAVTPEGNVWGCFLFHDYFKTRKDNPQYQDYYFGTLTDFIANHKTRYPEILANYSDLRQNFFQVECKETNFCFLCQDVKSCMVCPVNAAYSTRSLGKISCRQCQLNKIQLKALEDFHFLATKDTKKH
ncbi:MAG: radical SAM protein [Candidatus Aminicenantes bacterium]|nr:radical SAM protein [Candidatus Aminicenantes bacterium]NIM84720.1 radical SAM protein [Candidatus Aminicenantes bacterium]NIN24214.1 radical SAM protein [Candidatus Aminicenantes bacterium]NIN47941.1 radical SAM protein [Candidatus Aminicenantes bacterium]NIN90877.1 radical SAM protein [Candidatus Aminicenantes bacterium]